jgi:hypothetical protein
VADREARTPGDQLGLLAAESRQFNIDFTYAPGDRLALTASVGGDAGESSMRSMEFNENNKKNPSAVNTATLGPWTRTGSQWTADFEENTRFAGLGGSFEIVPGKVTADANYTMSLSELDITYGGFGAVNFDGTPFPTNHEFSFVSPETVENRSHSLNLGLEFPLVRNVGGRFGWQYESYVLRDWQQGGGTLQYEQVGSEYFLRDTSRSHQWGNRLYNMGAFLAPGYTGHALYFGLNYRFGGGM